MASPPENEGLLPTGEVGHAPRVGERPVGLPIDLVTQSVSRLRVLALLFAFVFFMVADSRRSGRQDRARLLGSFVLWGPGVISIAVALFVAALIRSARMPLSAKANLGRRSTLLPAMASPPLSFSTRRRSREGQLDGALLGGGVDGALHGRRANEAAPRVGSRPRLGQRSARHD